MTILMAPHGAPSPMMSRRTTSKRKKPKPNKRTPQQRNGRIPFGGTANAWRSPSKSGCSRLKGPQITELPDLYLGEISKFRISRKRANLRSINEPELSHAHRRYHHQVSDLCPPARYRSGRIASGRSAGLDGRSDALCPQR